MQLSDAERLAALCARHHVGVVRRTVVTESLDARPHLNGGDWALLFGSLVIGLLGIYLDLRFWPGAVVMMLIATVTAAQVTTAGRSAWFVGALVLMVYLTFATTLYLLPPRAQ